MARLSGAAAVPSAGGSALTRARACAAAILFAAIPIAAVAFAALALATLATAAAPPAHEPLREPLDRFPQADLLVDAGGRSHAFRVWLADTPARREQGLMWVKELPADRGMLFVFDRVAPASFWMKNTYVPLDLLFVAANGTIIRIAENATPLSLAPIGSMGPVLGVLELRGGTSAKLGLRPGHRVRHPAFAR